MHPHNQEEQPTMKKTIQREELAARIERGETFVLLEALPDKYFRAGHLPGARLFPHDQAAALAADMIRDMDAPVVLYCASDTCNNSHEAAETLTRLGYRDVSVYAGGKKDWTEAGLPLER
jgi:rhodanese-related sulfurtransferase